MNILYSSCRFGDGYTIILRLSEPSRDPCPVDAYIQSCFSGIELKERHHNVLQYQLPTHACSLAHVFDVLANHSKELGIANHSVSQTTLDQVTTQQKWLYGSVCDYFKMKLKAKRSSPIGFCQLCERADGWRRPAKRGGYKQWVRSSSVQSNYLSTATNF